MAIKTNIDTDTGLSVQNVYCRVEDIQCSSKNSMAFSLKYYVSQEINKAFETTNHGCPYTLEGKNPFAQAYEYLKTLPEFSDAVDC